MLSMLLGGGIVVIALVLGLIVLGLLSFIFWIWMLVDAVKNQNISDNERIAWVLVIVLTHFLGALIYFFAARTRPASRMPPPLPGRG